MESGGGKRIVEVVYRKGWAGGRRCMRKRDKIILYNGQWRGGGGEICEWG